MILGSLSVNGWVLCSCLASCLAWGVQLWSLLVIEWRSVLALRRRSLGELSPIDIMWGQAVSVGPMSWTWLSHLRGSGLTPGWSTKTLSATQLECLQIWRSWPAVAVLLHCPLKPPASSLFCPKGSVPQRKTVAFKVVTALRAFCFSVGLSRISLAHRGLHAEASHPALPTRAPSEELPPAPQLRLVCAEVGWRTLHPRWQLPN